MRTVLGAVFAVGLLASPAMAQSSYGTWNDLPDRFQVDTGYFRLSPTTKLRYSPGGSGGGEIELERDGSIIEMEADVPVESVLTVDCVVCECPVPACCPFENTVYMVGANRVGEEYTYTFFGDSMIVGPRGQVFGTVDGSEEGYVVARIDLDEIRRFREENQLFQCRQPQTYRAVVKKY